MAKKKATARKSGKPVSIKWTAACWWLSHGLHEVDKNINLAVYRLETDSPEGVERALGTAVQNLSRIKGAHGDLKKDAASLQEQVNDIQKTFKRAPIEDTILKMQVLKEGIWKVNKQVGLACGVPRQYFKA